MLLNIQNYRDFFDAHFLEQYFTASQFNLHFFLQLNGKLHVTHTFHSRFFFINTLVVEVEGSIGSSVELRNEAARLKTAEKMNTPPVKTKKLAGCHFWDKQTNVGHDLADNKNIPNSPSKTKPRQPCKTDGDCYETSGWPTQKLPTIQRAAKCKCKRFAIATLKEKHPADFSHGLAGCLYRISLPKKGCGSPAPVIKI